MCRRNIRYHYLLFDKLVAVPSSDKYMQFACHEARDPSKTHKFETSLHAWREDRGDPVTGRKGVAQVVRPILVVAWVGDRH